MTHQPSLEEIRERAAMRSDAWKSTEQARWLAVAELEEKEQCLARITAEASYALRYRHGIDPETLRKALLNIVELTKQQQSA